MKISDVITGYWLDKKIDFSHHTVEQYSVVFRRLIEFVNDKEFDQVSSEDIRRFLDHILTTHKVSKRTLSNSWIVLSSLWTWAETELKTSHVIRGKVKRPRFPKTIIEPFAHDELRRMAKAAEHTRLWETSTGKQAKARRPTAARDVAIILVLFDTGIRAQELCDLTIADYDQERGRLHIRHGKGDKQRFVVMGNRTRKAIWRYLTTRPKAKQKDPLFSAGANSINSDNLRKMLKQIGENAGVKGVHPHKFRHTFAINFLRNGGNVLLLKELLGHESLEMVTVYVHLAEQDIDQGQAYSPVDNLKI